MKRRGCEPVPMLTAPVTDAALQPARASAPDPVVLYGAFGLLLFGPLAFGAVEPWSIFILEAGAALLLVRWTIRQVASGELSVSGEPAICAHAGVCLPVSACSW